MAKLFKRGSVYYAWVPKHGGGVEKRSTLCTDKKAALVVAAKLERLAVDPTYAARNAATVERTLREYLASRERMGRAEGTIHHVRVKSGHLLRLLPARAEAVTHDVCEGYIDARLAEGARRTTVKKELRVLKAALSLAAKNGRFAANPDAVIPELEDDYKPRTRFLEPLELVALVRALGEGERAAVVAMIVATGARWSEAMRFEAADVRTEEGAVYTHLHGTKTKLSARVVPIVGVARPILAWALAHMQGNTFTPWLNVRRDLHAACERAGIEPVTPNDLRRTMATWLQRAGVGNDLVAKAMGHVDSRMVERVYGRMSPVDLGRLLTARTGDTGILMGGSQTESGPSQVNEENAIAGNAAKTSAQGRNRTADTGIFKPNVERDDVLGIVGDVAVTPREWDTKGRYFVAQARAALTDLALRAGITVVP